MAETNLTAFANGVASYLSSIIFPAIVQGFAAKGVATSVEELLAMTQTPAARAPATPVMPAPAVPTMAFGGAVPPMATAVAPTTARKNTATAAPLAGRTCAYQFKRGENKGKFCGKAVAPGSEFCNQCLKTRKNLGAPAAGGAVPGAAPGMGAIPGMAGLPPGYTAPIAAQPATATAAAQPGQFTVAPYDEARGLYKDPVNNFIVYQVREGVIAVIGYLVETETPHRIAPLSDAQKLTAQNIGLILGENQQGTAPAQPAAAPAPATIPQIPAAQPAAIPQIPAAVPAAIPTAQPGAVIQPTNPLVGTGQPALPTIAPLAGTPTIPAAVPAGGIPQIPGIPQLTMS
ncbi:Hypothetical protein HVR_LOCUS1229 [uncultured virus]|nr:Hypothetical protein HVR_LOCUS1229 [uncultured virus]